MYARESSCPAPQLPCPQGPPGRTCLPFWGNRFCLADPTLQLLLPWPRSFCLAAAPPGSSSNLVRVAVGKGCGLVCSLTPHTFPGQPNPHLYPGFSHPHTPAHLFRLSYHCLPLPPPGRVKVLYISESAMVFPASA